METSCCFRPVKLTGAVYEENSRIGWLHFNIYVKEEPGLYMVRVAAVLKRKPPACG